MNISEAKKHKKTAVIEIIWSAIFKLCGFISVFITLGIFFTLLYQAVKFFINYKISIFDFLFKTKWEPDINHFGFLPLLTATLTTSFIAIMIAFPLGILTAVMLSEYTKTNIKQIIKPVLEVLSGIPTIVYGYFAIQTITPFLRIFFPDLGIYNMLSASIAMGILVLPLVSSLVESGLSSVPTGLKESGYGLGARKYEIVLSIMLPYAKSNIVSAFIISFSRCIGETMIVALASGAGSAFTINPLRSAETITGYIARMSGGDIAYGTPIYQSIFVLGFILFVITLILNILGKIILKEEK